MKSRPLFLFAPGAGAPSTHLWMQKWAKSLTELGDVVLFDYPYMKEGRKRPDPPAQLVTAHGQALAGARRDSPMFLIGKSMGGRIGCHVALDERVDGVICLGYPLCGGGNRANLRDKVLLALRTPVLFVQGTRDPLCPLDLLEEVRTKMTAPNFLHVVEGGDHSLIVLKKQLAAGGMTQEDVDETILQAISSFTEERR